MKSPSVVRAAIAAAFLLVVGALGAQPVTKAPPRLPENPSASGRIPAGVDSGTPASSDSQQLGTPVPPTLGSEGGEMRARGAAARAAARPKPAASSVDCVRPAAATAPGKGASAPATAKTGAASTPQSSSVVRNGTNGC